MPSSLRLSLEVLRRRPFFTFVSLFGIAFTLTTLLVVSAMLDGLLAPRAPEVHMDRSLYLNRANVFSDNNDFHGPPGYGLLDEYCRDLPGVEITTFYSNPRTSLAFVNGQRVETEVRHCDAEYWRAFRFDFLEGRAFDASDVEAARPVVVIDASTRRAFFGEESAIGRTLPVGDRAFEVIGVVPDVDPMREATTGNAWTTLTTHPADGWQTQQRGDFSACFVATSPAAFDAIRAELDARMEAWEPKPGTLFTDARVFPQTRLQELAQEALGAPRGENPVARFAGLLALIAFVFMLLPAVNLVNVNMSRILERASEIGVRKAFGASNGELVRQFVIENVVLCVLGGLISFVLAGFVAELSAGAGWLEGSRLQLSPRVFLVGLALSVFFGVLSGILPAWRMARLQPVQALRGGER